MAALTGYEAIAQYLSSCTETVKKYIREYGLPVHRMGNAKNAPIITTSDEVDQWIRGLPNSAEVTDEQKKTD